jgi:hypothetical protein
MAGTTRRGVAKTRQEPIGNRFLLVVAEHRINTYRLAYTLWRSLRITAGENDLGVRGKAPRQSDEVTRFSVRDMGHRAGVDDDSVRTALRTVDYAYSTADQATRDHCGIGLVKLTAKGEDGDYRIFWHHRS